MLLKMFLPLLMQALMEHGPAMLAALLKQISDQLKVPVPAGFEQYLNEQGVSATVPENLQSQFDAVIAKCKEEGCCEETAT